MKQDTNVVTEGTDSTGAVCGLAALSQLLGFLTLTVVLAPVTAIPAILCGHVARARIRRSNGRLGGAELAMRGLLLGYLSVVLLGLIIPTSIGVLGRLADSAKERALRGKCRDNLIQLGIYMGAYAERNAGRGPADLASLERYGAKPENFVCPAGGHTSGPMAAVKDWSDYAYARDSLGMLGADQYIIAFCRCENHQGRGGNLLLSDGTVVWVDAAQLKQALETRPPPPALPRAPKTPIPPDEEEGSEAGELGEAGR